MLIAVGPSRSPQVAENDDEKRDGPMIVMLLRDQVATDRGVGQWCGHQANTPSYRFGWMASR